jgi:hypothetical protein
LKGNNFLLAAPREIGYFIYKVYGTWGAQDGWRGSWKSPKSCLLPFPQCISSETPRYRSILRCGYNSIRRQRVRDRRPYFFCHKMSEFRIFWKRHELNAYSAI